MNNRCRVIICDCGCENQSIGKPNLTMILPTISLQYNDDVMPLGLHEETPKGAHR